MPIKIIVMVRRKPGLSTEEFRDGYENSHARIAVELFGHLWTEYRRNYLQQGMTFAGDQGGADEVGFDAVSEFVLRDAAALEEMQRISAQHFDRIKEDEARWFDQAHCWMIPAETVEEKLSAA